MVVYGYRTSELQSRFNNLYCRLLCEQLSLCENWPLENKVPMRSPYAFCPGVALR